jgi:hypothetical protein
MEPEGRVTEAPYLVSLLAARHDLLCHVEHRQPDALVGQVLQRVGEEPSVEALRTTRTADEPAVELVVMSPHQLSHFVLLSF